MGNALFDSGRRVEAYPLVVKCPAAPLCVRYAPPMRLERPAEPRCTGYTNRSRCWTVHDLPLDDQALLVCHEGIERELRLSAAPVVEAGYLVASVFDVGQGDFQILAFVCCRGGVVGFTPIRRVVVGAVDVDEHDISSWGPGPLCFGEQRRAVLIGYAGRQHAAHPGCGR